MRPGCATCSWPSGSSEPPSVEGAGHFLPFENPTAFLDALVPFLEETAPAAATEARFHEVLLQRSAEADEAAGRAPLDDAGVTADDADDAEPWSA